MKHSLQLRLSQHLTLTPQLQQSIRLLQLSTLELNQEIEKFLQDNPLLDRDDGIREEPVSPPPQAGTGAESISSADSGPSSSAESPSGDGDTSRTEAADAGNFDEAFSYSSGIAHDD